MKHKNYLYEYDNRAIVAFFLTMAIFNLIIIYKNKCDINTINTIITISGISGFAVITPIVCWFFNIKKPKVYSESKNNWNVSSSMEFVGIINEKQLNITTDLRVIKRENHINNIFSLIERKFNEKGFKSIVLTGDSGSGKSILISMLKDYLENKKYSVELKRNFNTFDIPSNKQIIFLDQFENVLNYINFINKIKEYSKENNCVFVFSFPQSYLSRMSNLFVSNGIDNALRDIYVLSLNNDEIQQYKRKISNFCNIDETYIDKYINDILEENSDMQSVVNINGSIECKKLCDALIKVVKGKAPLIELELLGYILSFNYGSDKRFSKEYSFIDVPLDDWVSRFLHKETAYSILYLMSEFRKFNIDDIRLATFGERKHYEYDIQNKKDGLLLKSLKDNPFIYTDNNYGLCMAKHQYISEQFRRYCQDKEIPEGVRNYIPYLIRCIDNKKDKNSEYSYEKLDENYNRYYSNHTGILVMLIVMFIGVLVINIIQINKQFEVHCQLIANSLISLPSIYYIYNYCKRFFLISKNFMATFTYIAGAIGIVASYYYINWWGVLFGAEIMILAISIFVAYHNKKSKTINKIFVKDCLVFGSIGFVISVLGVIFFFLFSPLDSYEQTPISFIACEYSYYGLFLIYSLLSVINHIKYSYIIGRIDLSNIVK